MENTFVKQEKENLSTVLGTAYHLHYASEDGAEYKITLTGEEDIITTCPSCRKEFSLNLSEFCAIMGDDDCDIYSTTVYCSECSEKRQSQNGGRDSQMRLKEFAEMLNNSDYGDEITAQEVQAAKERGFVAAFAYSDDCMEFRGAIDGEAGCYDGRTVHLTKDGLFDDGECECKYYMAAKNQCKTITAVWCGDEGYEWHYETEILHETFDIYRDGEKYCRGIVFDVKDLAN